MYPNRISRLKDEMQNAKFDVLALNPGPSLTYLTGLDFHLMERPVILLMTRKNEFVIVLPELEKAKLASLPFPIKSFTYGDNPASWKASFEQAGRELQLSGSTIGLEPTRFRYLELKFLQDSVEGAAFTSAEEVLSLIRMQKDPTERGAMRKAALIAQDALTQTLPLVKFGMTEKDFAAEISLQLLRAGSDPEFPFQPIVSTAANTANPHASPSEKDFQPGHFLLVDWGARYGGYCSDITRVFALGDLPPQLTEIYQVVENANQAGRAACKPGILAGEVDRAARKVIQDAGYAQYFFHRTGHGLGLEAHEAPYIFSENIVRLEPGMTFTVEPGIYLAGVGGVRIEDDMVITDSGAESFSDFPRELRQIA